MKDTLAVASLEDSGYISPSERKEDDPSLLGAAKQTTKLHSTRHQKSKADLKNLSEVKNKVQTSSKQSSTFSSKLRTRSGSKEIATKNTYQKLDKKSKISKGKADSNIMKDSCMVKEESAETIEDIISEVDKIKTEID